MADTVTDLPDSLPDADWLKSFRRRLLTWYRKHARVLPWRETTDPYAIWVSEIMLQQTQVETVKRYFSRFLARFPTVHKLAAAQETEVLRLWEGLGYYRRARQMCAAAQVIQQQYDGCFPKDAQTVQGLPGIGRYTAGAIVSIAHDAREPILEANTTRLFARLLAYPDDPVRSAGQKVLWAMARHVLPRKNCGIFNQALMELGSEVCTPRNPDCQSCPALGLCAAQRQNQVGEIPLAKRKTKFIAVHEAAVVIRRRNQVLLRRCGDDERWAGLWDFPRFALDSPRNISRQLIRGVESQTGLEIDPGDRLTRIKHGVTRYRITLDCFEAQLANSRQRAKDGTWVTVGDLDDYPLSTTGRRIGRLLSSP